MKDQKKTSNWTGSSGNTEWNDSSNWEPNKVPTDKATFENPGQTVISFSPDIEAKIDTIEFSEDAPSFTFKFGTADASPALTLKGDGIVNKSTSMQSVVVASTGAHYQVPKLKFSNKASAGTSTVSYYAGPESLKDGYGGGIIGFTDKSTAGSAQFFVRTGAVAPPKDIDSTVGAEVSFSDKSTAGTASFTIYGTLGTDGDTFGNVVFHDHASADHGTFTNIGGTVHGGDGGNTQLYDKSSAAYGVYLNFGGTHEKANGGDVAFDGNADGGYAKFYNYAAPADGAYGGVTSFNNNPPDMKGLGASAGHASYHNFGAEQEGQGGGGHTELTAKHGSPTAAHGKFVNYGSVIDSKSSAGHTIFSVEMPTKYNPTAGHATIWNQPAPAKGGAGGFTEFAMYGVDNNGPNVPTAGKATIINLGGFISGANGGFTTFSGRCSAGKALLIATGGTNGGYGGKIAFYDNSSADEATIQLIGNGELSIGNLQYDINVGTLELTGGIISMQLGLKYPKLNLLDNLILNADKVWFSFWSENNGFEYNRAYKIMTAPNLSDFSVDQFDGNDMNGAEPTFEIKGNELNVIFCK